MFGDWTANIAGNWFFIAAMTFIFLPVIWYLTDRVIEPKFGKYDASKADHEVDDATEDRPLTAGEKKGLKRAGLAALGVIVAWVSVSGGPGTPLT